MRIGTPCGAVLLLCRSGSFCFQFMTPFSSWESGAHRACETWGRICEGCAAAVCTWSRLHVSAFFVSAKMLNMCPPNQALLRFMSCFSDAVMTVYVVETVFLFFAE